MKKEFAVYGIIAFIGILGFVLYDQQLQIDNLERQMHLENAIDSCGQYIMNVDAYGRCADESFVNWGTSEQLASYRQSQLESEQKAISEKKQDEIMYKIRMDNCRSTYIGQTEKLLWCFDRAESYLSTGAYEPYP